MSFTRSFSGSATAVSGSTTAFSTTTTGSFTATHVTSVTLTVSVHTNSGQSTEWYLDNPAAPSTSTFSSFYCGVGSGTFTRTWSSAELADMPNAFNVFKLWPRSIRAAVGVIATITSMTLTVTATGDDDPTPPPPPGPITTTVLKFVEDLPDKIQYNTDYTVIFKAIRPNGTKHPYSSGTVTLQIQEGSTIKSTGFTVNGAAPASTPITFTEGQATCTLRFPSGVDQCAAETNLYLHTVKGTFKTGGTTTTAQFGPVASPHSVIAGAGLQFTVQPPAIDEVGHVFTTPVQVSAVTGGGVVNTAWNGDITLTMRNLAGEDTTSLLGGGKTITPVNGVATFPTLFISKAGFYILTATSTVATLTLTGVSTGILITGSDGEQTLRQNIRDDGTVWVKTTNISSPTYATYTADNKSMLDGDETSTSNVVNDGTRWAFPWTMKVTKVRFKVKLSTLASAPIISLYSSQDTTTGQDGTWTLQTSMTPATTGVFIAQFVMSTPLYAKGLWLTLNDNGGAATATWYSQQVMGKYLGAPIVYEGGDVIQSIDTEHYISIPGPIETLSGAQVKYRSMQLRNTTAADIEVLITTTPARYGGDTLMDGDNLQVLDSTLQEVLEQVTVPAYSTLPFVLRYTVTAADNDNTDKHYSRFTVLPVVEITTGYYHSIDSSGGTGCVAKTRLIATGAGTATRTTGVSVSKGLFAKAGTALWTIDKYGNAAPTLQIYRTVDVQLSLAQHLAQAFYIAGFTAGEVAREIGIGVADDRILFSLDNSTTVYVLTGISAIGFINTLAYPKASLGTFTIAAQTTGVKQFWPGPSNTVFLQNGTAVNSVLYRISNTGYSFATIDPTSQFGGRGVQCAIWDGTRSELYVASSVSGGSRVISRFTSAGVHIASVSTTTEAALDVTGMQISAPYVLVMYGGCKLYRHDLQTMANATLLSDNTGLSQGPDLPGGFYLGIGV